MAAIRNSLNITTTNTDISLYSVPSGKATSFSLNLCNRTSGKVLVRVFFSSNNSPAPGEYIEYDAELLPNDTLQRLGLVLPSGDSIFVRSNTSGVSAVMWGFEETA